MTSSNLVARPSSAKMEVKRSSTERAEVARSFAPVLLATFQHGDRSSVAAALVLPPQRIDAMCWGSVQNPFDQAAIVCEQLQKNGNPGWDAPYIALSRRLNFTTFRNTSCPDDVRFAQLLNEVSEVVRTRASIDDPNSDGGAEHTADELRMLAARTLDLAAQATAYANALVMRAAAKETR
jgi:hypothetical protein